MAVSSAATSATLRPIGPGGVLAVADRHDVGAADTGPTVGLSPTSPFMDEGQVTEPSVSVPTPTAARLAAIAAPVPEEEPQAVRSSA